MSDPRQRRNNEGGLIGRERYIPQFLTKEETEDLFQACDSLPFVIGKTQYGVPRRHSEVAFVQGAIVSQRGHILTQLIDAPRPIQTLAKKLTEFAGTDINYLSVVRYRDGNDYIPFHQHRSDKGRDASVYIVSTGAERPFAIRPLGGKSHRIFAEEGSLIVLPSSFNDTHEHGVPKCKVQDVRYSINAKHVPSGELA